MTEWGGYSSWSQEATRAPFLVTPVRLLWRSYLRHCELWGFDAADAGDFIQWLRGEEGVELREGGHGRLRRMAVGITASMVSDEGDTTHIEDRTIGARQ